MAANTYLAYVGPSRSAASALSLAAQTTWAMGSDWYFLLWKLQGREVRKLVQGHTIIKGARIPSRKRTRSQPPDLPASVPKPSIPWTHLNKSHR